MEQGLRSGRITQGVGRQSLGVRLPLHITIGPFCQGTELPKESVELNLDRIRANRSAHGKDKRETAKVFAVLLIGREAHGRAANPKRDTQAGHLLFQRGCGH
jgi:hypothetical protein